MKERAVCGSGEENIMHVLKECEATKDEILIEEFLSKERKVMQL